MMNTWKKNLEETKKHYIDWWNHKGIVLNMWEHFQNGVTPHADVPAPAAPVDLNQKWFDPKWRADYLDWYVAHSSLKADILPVANTHLGPGSLAAILGGVFEGGEDTIWIHPDPKYTDDIKFDENHPNWLLHKELLRACKNKANGNYYVGMPDLMEGLDVLAAMKGTDKVLLDTVMQPDVLERQMRQINEIYFKVFDELYDIIREGDEMAFCYFSSWAPGKMAKIQSDISTMISVEDYRRFVQPFIREQCQRIDYTLYHLDGVGALHHLPALLEVEELNAVQWTPGVGEPQGGSPKWYDLYRRILGAGKSIMACWVTLDELRPLLDNIGGDGVHLEMDFHSEDEVEQAMKIVEEYRGRPAIKREESEVIKIDSPAFDADAEVARIIEKVENETMAEPAPTTEIAQAVTAGPRVEQRSVNVSPAVPEVNVSIPDGVKELHIHVHIHMEGGDAASCAPKINITNSASATKEAVAPKGAMRPVKLTSASEPCPCCEPGAKDAKGDAESAGKEVFEAIVAGKSDDAANATRRAIDSGAKPQEIINGSMISAMGEVGQRFQDGKAFVPQLLMAGRAMKSALELLKPMMAGSASTTIGKVVIGTVKGDLHDIGKNLVASMLEGCGFEVINVGIDVPSETFVEEVRKSQADILCMSALLTTTMTYMKDVIKALEDAGLRDKVKVMVGGAPVTQNFADEIGADGYSDNANTAVALARRLVGKQ